MFDQPIRFRQGRRCGCSAPRWLLLPSLSRVEASMPLSSEEGGGRGRGGTRPEERILTKGRLGLLGRAEPVIRRIAINPPTP